jgi:hypothetical protein
MQSACRLDYASRITRVAEKLPHHHGEYMSTAKGEAVTSTVSIHACCLLEAYRDVDRKAITDVSDEHTSSIFKL